MPNCDFQSCGHCETLGSMTSLYEASLVLWHVTNPVPGGFAYTALNYLSGA